MKDFPIRRAIMFLALLAFVAGCTTTPSPPPVPTSQPTTDLSTLELSEVVLQKSELPNGFSVYDSVEFDTIFPTVEAAHTGVESSIVVYSKTEDSRQVFTNGIIIYDDEEQADKAFDAIVDFSRDNNEVQVAQIGERTFALNETITSEAIANTIYLVMVLWREGESVVYLSAANSDTWPTREEMEKYAGQIQARLTGEEAPPLGE